LPMWNLASNMNGGISGTLRPWSNTMSDRNYQIWKSRWAYDCPGCGQRHQTAARGFPFPIHCLCGQWYTVHEKTVRICATPQGPIYMGKPFRMDRAANAKADRDFHRTKDGGYYWQEQCHKSWEVK
jgi:hypothetical protein